MVQEINLEQISKGILAWLEEMARDLEPGRFRFCSKGSYVPTTGKEGVVSTCFAMRSAWQDGIWEMWPPDRKKGCIEFIQSFQRNDGYFFDKWLAKNAKIGLMTLAAIALSRTPINIIWSLRKMNLRAETRQCAVDLLNVGARPLHPLPEKWQKKDEAHKFLRSLDWTNPWSAASHLSHLMFFLSFNQNYFNNNKNYEMLIDLICDYIYKYYDSKTGTW